MCTKASMNEQQGRCCFLALLGLAPQSRVACERYKAWSSTSCTHYRTRQSAALRLGKAHCCQDSDQPRVMNVINTKEGLPINNGARIIQDSQKPSAPLLPAFCGRYGVPVRPPRAQQHGMSPSDARCPLKELRAELSNTPSQVLDGLAACGLDNPVAIEKPRGFATRHVDASAIVLRNVKHKCFIHSIATGFRVCCSGRDCLATIVYCVGWVCVIPLTTTPFQRLRDLLSGPCSVVVGHCRHTNPSRGRVCESTFLGFWTPVCPIVGMTEQPGKDWRGSSSRTQLRSHPQSHSKRGCTGPPTP